jgi:hypothetical protein
VDQQQTSDLLNLQLAELYADSANKSRLLTPEEAKVSPFLAMVEILLKITDAVSSTDEQSNELFAQFYSVCLRGTNPFKESVLKKAGVESKSWKRLLRTVSGDF